MTISELLGRIALAFKRTFSLFAERKLGDLVLLDIGIVTVLGVLGLSLGLAQRRH